MKPTLELAVLCNLQSILGSASAQATQNIREWLILNIDCTKPINVNVLADSSFYGKDARKSTLTRIIWNMLGKCLMP